MRLPRDPSGAELARAMARLGYRVTRQESSHVRLTTTLDDEHLVTVPAHDPLKIGTLSGILLSLQQHHKIKRKALVRRLFGH
jgi:predicted RNA binding protein YcfA (HicA-like mRNA interferase family)